MTRWLAVVVPLALVTLSLARPAAAHGGLDRELAALDAKLAKHPERVDWLIERAALQRMRGDFGAALADLDEVSEIDPEVPELCLERGLVFAHLGYPHEADRDLGCYLGHQPYHGRALAWRARVREQMGLLAQARDDYQRALFVDPSVDTFLEYGRLEERQGSLEVAASCYTRGLGLLHEAIVLKRALVRVETARRRYGRAIELLDTLIASHAFKADAYLDRADVYEAAGALDKARADRQRALALIDRALARRSSAMRLRSRRRALLALGMADEGAAEDDDLLPGSPAEGRRALAESRRALRHP